MTSKEQFRKSEIPSCSYQCNVKEDCIYHLTPYNADYSLHPKYCGDDGCKFFKAISKHNKIPTLPSDRFLGIIGEL